MNKGTNNQKVSEMSMEAAEKRYAHIKKYLDLTDAVVMSEFLALEERLGKGNYASVRG